MVGSLIGDSVLNLVAEKPRPGPVEPGQVGRIYLAELMGARRWAFAGGGPADANVLLAPPTSIIQQRKRQSISLLTTPMPMSAPPPTKRSPLVGRVA